MKIPEIKRLVEHHTYEDLQLAESMLVEDVPLEIEVNGVDEGEKLTHIIAAMWILAEMKTRNLDFKDALREYTRKVRESIN